MGLVVMLGYLDLMDSPKDVNCCAPLCVRRPMGGSVCFGGSGCLELSGNLAEMVRSTLFGVSFFNQDDVSCTSSDPNMPGQRSPCRWMRMTRCSLLLFLI